MAHVLQHRAESGYTVLDELTDTQVEMLRFLARQSPYLPRGAVPSTTRALEWRGLITRVPEDGNRWHATESGCRALAELLEQGEDQDEVAPLSRRVGG